VFSVITFYALAGIAIAAAFMVVAARNPVHSVMFLILTFFSAAGLFVLMGVAKLPDDGVSNLEAIGKLLYTDYAFFFEAAGLVLLVAMIGAIVLTLRTQEGVKRQDVSKQIARTREDGVEMIDIKSGEGIGS